MNPAVQTALIQLGLRAADTIIFDLLVPWVESLVQAQADPIDTIGMARELVRGIEQDHPDWPGRQKADHAKDALRLWLGGKHVSLPERDINFLIEAAVQGVGRATAVEVDRA